MYRFFDGVDATEFASLEAMAAHEHGLLTRAKSAIFRSAKTATGHRSLTDYEARNYQYALEAADRDGMELTDPFTDPTIRVVEPVKYPLAAPARTWVHLHFYRDNQPIIRTVIINGASSMLHITTEKHGAAFSTSSDRVHSVDMDVSSDVVTLVTVWLK